MRILSLLVLENESRQRQKGMGKTLYLTWVVPSVTRLVSLEADGAPRGSLDRTFLFAI